LGWLRAGTSIVGEWVIGRVLEGVGKMGGSWMGLGVVVNG
jgi:hypothetical protein